MFPIKQWCGNDSRSISVQAGPFRILSSVLVVQFFFLSHTYAVLLNCSLGCVYFTSQDLQLNVNMLNTESLFLSEVHTFPFDLQIGHLSASRYENKITETKATITNAAIQLEEHLCQNAYSVVSQYLWKLSYSYYIIGACGHLIVTAICAC